jgi:hypothetical protein
MVVFPLQPFITGGYIHYMTYSFLAGTNNPGLDMENYENRGEMNHIEF